MYAIIEDSGTQIKVSEGDIIRVDMRDLADDAQSVTFDRVLMIGGDEKKTKIGQPVLSGASVTADILDPDDSDTHGVREYTDRVGGRGPRRGPSQGHGPEASHGTRTIFVTSQVSRSRA